MLPIKALLSTAILASTVLASATNQVALYWGQNSVGLEETAGGQERLATYCANDEVDIVLLSFLNFFPDPVNLNFANQCGDTYPSGLLHCQRIAEDIKTCQANGKKVLLSLGGAAGNYGFESTGSATDFATTLWNKFGPVTAADDERPFDDAVIDGFDFDIEIPNANGQSVGYPELATALRSKFSEDSSKQYYLSAAPQCPYPDALLKDLMSKVPLDYAFIQFYNNPCSIDQQFNYDTWQSFAETAPNSDIQLFVGVPATSNIAGYVDAQELATALDKIKCDSNFAGVSIWDASGAWSNTDSSGDNYVVQVKNVLNDNVCEAPSSSASEEEPQQSSTEEEEPSSSAIEELSSSSVTEETTTTDEESSSATPESSIASSHHWGNSTVSSTQSATGSSTGSSTQSAPSTTKTGSTKVTGTTSGSSKATGTVAGSSKVTGSSSVKGSGFITVTDIKHTVITITSCSENKCSATPVTTGVVVVTDVNTVYTTYCPLTNSEVVIPVESASVNGGAVTEENKVVITESCSEETSTTASVHGGAVTEGHEVIITETCSEGTAATASASASASAPVHEGEHTVASASAPAPGHEGENTSAPVLQVSSSHGGVVVSSTVIPVTTKSGETGYTTVEVTSTVVPYPIPTPISSYTNGTVTPAGNNGTVPVFTYEGGAVANTLNTAWFTLPLLLVALAF